MIPRRGMFVSAIDVDELSMLYETRAIMEPYAARLATLRGTRADWDEMADGARPRPNDRAFGPTS